MSSTRLLALCLAASACVGSTWTVADDGDCSRFELYGIRPGMDSRSVRKLMADRGVRSAAGAASGITYITPQTEIYVEYAGAVSRRQDSRVRLVRAGIAARATSSGDLARDLLTRFGEPTEGRTHLEAGLRTGPVLWIDEGCGIEARAFLRETSWWEPSQDSSVLLQIEALERGAASPADSHPSERSEAAAGESVAAADPGQAVEREPELIPASYVAPVYPRLAKRAGARGEVVLRATVLDDGTVGDVVVLRAPARRLGLDKAAVAAIRRWRYDPATRDGRAVQSSVLVTITFR